jgi:hypothetical protein
MGAKGAAKGGIGAAEREMNRNPLSMLKASRQKGEHDSPERPPGKN